LNQVFSRNEVKEIEKIVSYVDQLVLSDSDIQDIDLAYHHYIERIKQSTIDGHSFVPVSDEEKYLFFESLDSTVFNEIWLLGNQVRMVRYNDSIYHNLEGFQTLDLNYDGRFLKYLELLGENDEFFKMAYESMEITGGMNPTLFVTFLMEHEQFDFTISRNRLWAAVFILSIEENIGTKLERYLKLKNKD